MSVPTDPTLNPGDDPAVAPVVNPIVDAAGAVQSAENSGEALPAPTVHGEIPINSASPPTTPELALADLGVLAGLAQAYADTLSIDGKKINCVYDTVQHTLVITDNTDPANPRKLFEAKIAPAATQHKVGMHASAPQAPAEQSVEADFYDPKAMGPAFIQKYLSKSQNFNIKCGDLQQLLDFISMSGQFANRITLDENDPATKAIVDANKAAIDGAVAAAKASSGITATATPTSPAPAVSPGKP